MWAPAPPTNLLQWQGACFTWRTSRALLKELLSSFCNISLHVGVRGTYHYDVTESPDPGPLSCHQGYSGTLDWVAWLFVCSVNYTPSWIPPVTTTWIVDRHHHGTHLDIQADSHPPHMYTDKCKTGNWQCIKNQSTERNIKFIKKIYLWIS